MSYEELLLYSVAVGSPSLPLYTSRSTHDLLREVNVNLRMKIFLGLTQHIVLYALSKYYSWPAWVMCPPSWLE